MQGGKVKGTDFVLSLPTMPQIVPLTFPPCIIMEISDMVYDPLHNYICDMIKGNESDVTNIDFEL